MVLPLVLAMPDRQIEKSSCCAYGQKKCEDADEEAAEC